MVSRHKIKYKFIKYLTSCNEITLNFRFELSRRIDKMNRKLQLGKASKVSEVRMTAENVTRTLALAKKIASPEATLPITEEITFSLELKNATQYDDSVSIFFEFVNKGKFEDQVLWYKTHVYKVITLPSGETQRELVYLSDNVFCPMELKEDTYGYCHYYKCGLPKDQIVIDDKVDLVGVVEEAYVVENVTLDWNVKQMSARRMLSGVYDNDNLKDIKFTIENQSLGAHRAILAAKSKVFCAMFTNDCKEKQEGVVQITDTRIEVFEAFLKFFYTNKIENIKELGEELLILAEKYQVQDLKDKCENYLSQILNKDNAVHCLITADQFNCQKLKKNALNVIKFLLKDCDNFNELLKFQHLMEEIFDLLDQDRIQGRPAKRARLDNSETTESNVVTSDSSTIIACSDTTSFSEYE